MKEMRTGRPLKIGRWLGEFQNEKINRQLKGLDGRRVKSILLSFRERKTNQSFSFFNAEKLPSCERSSRMWENVGCIPQQWTYD